MLKVSQQRYSEGLAHLLEAYHVYHTIDYKEGMAHCLSGIADAYERTGQLSLALMQAKECLHLARELNSKLLISQASGILAKVYKRQRDYPKALEYFELFHLYQDSLLDAENIRQLEGLRFSFQLDKKEVENGKLRQEQALQEARSQKQLMLMLLTGGGLLVTLLIMVLLWKSNQSRKRTNLLLTRQKDSIGQQNASLAALNTKISQQRDHLWKLHRESEQHKAQILCQNEALSVTNEKLSELDREKDGLMSVVAHDLRAPLNRTIGLTQLIRLTGSLNDEQENLLQLIEKSAREGGYLINDLLTLSYEQQAGHKVTLSQICLPDWIETLLIGFRPQAEAKSIELHYQKPAAACLIDTNEEALTRILDNLLSNALKFTQPGKNVFVTLSTSPDGIRISVLDEGPGISPEEQQKLFKKFQKLTPRPTGNESSTGLGLAIVKTLSEKIGGEISVQSELGKGTQFTLFIPQSLCEQTDTHTLNLSAN